LILKTIKRNQNESGFSPVAPTVQRTISRVLRFGALSRNPPNPVGPTNRAAEAENLLSRECPKEANDTEAMAAIRVRVRVWS